MLKNRIKRWLENYPNVYVGRLSKKNLFRSLTSNSRILPDFIIIGGIKMWYDIIIQLYDPTPCNQTSTNKRNQFF